MENHTVRIVLFLLIFAVILAFEQYLPKRKLQLPRTKRWSRNFSLLAVDIAAVRILLPATLAETAFIANSHSIGLFNIVPVPFLANVLITILCFDLLIYAQHCIFHKIKPLWKIHRVHHTDTELDATTAVRFHPAEILLSTLLKMAGILILAPHVAAIVLYEILLSSAAIFTHGNIRLPAKLEKITRMLFVTPDMHRIHHSVHPQETDSNYGNLFSCWDRIFRTYTGNPRDGQQKMQIGLAYYRDEEHQKIQSLLLLPFLKRDIQRPPA